MANLGACGVRFGTVACTIKGCNTCFDVDSNHPYWPDGPFLCHKHEEQRDRLPRRLAPNNVALRVEQRKSHPQMHSPMFKITPNVLKEAGFRFYTQPFNRPHCDGVWQKIVRRSDGRQLFGIEVYLWNRPDGHKSIGAKSCMYLSDDDDGHDGFWIEKMVREKTDLENVEDFFRLTYELLGCIPDPVNS